MSLLPLHGTFNFSNIISHQEKIIVIPRGLKIQLYIYNYSLRDSAIINSTEKYSMTILKLYMLYVKDLIVSETRVRGFLLSLNRDKTLSWEYFPIKNNNRSYRSRSNQWKCAKEKLNLPSSGKPIQSARLPWKIARPFRRLAHCTNKTDTTNHELVSHLRARTKVVRANATIGFSTCNLFLASGKPTITGSRRPVTSTNCYFWGQPSTRRPLQYPWLNHAAWSETDLATCQLTARQVTSISEFTEN